MDTSIQIRTVDPDSPEAIYLMDLLSNALQAITGDSGRSSFNKADVVGPRTRFVVATDPQGRAVGCGAYRSLDRTVAEIKRMFALPGTSGVGSAILSYLEDKAKAEGYAEAWLETRRVNERATNFYRRHGYREIPNFGKYEGMPEAVCFAKNL
ncbi:GNAT family N-acetyltransferase [Rhizobium chutanense]|uniref:GNAT family N-acetyltransferase n=1 Tax=Rhizobium chutanense TaxID=2035448 RepID=A0A2A6J1F6_9HYPH|nr:GNAT family N-acetyltransferase [Rhizobium chutanense]PDT00019.1 GNAT family N-acetyltransferase [Rhizobium chutanense]